ncbi:unnamed protein product [Paramecium sonneborni]|uniref:Cation-transporting ATPase n=1 Tax=Paramecium sonneborni TaxID=65129 RepID=A0A8S1PND2_9CILI|nr:unnamed protein product [Paramecium sonneborni]
MKQPFINHNYRVQFKHPINIQQEGLIQEIISCRISVFKTVLFGFLSLITCGLLYLVTRWDLRIFLFFRAKKCVPKSATHFLIIGQDKSQTLVKSNCSKDGSLFIEYRLYRYTYSECGFDPIETKYQNMIQQEIRQQSINRNQQLEIFGQNNTEIPDKGILKTLIEEVLSPFYIFQFCSVLLWFWASYQRYATVILLTSLISIFITLYEQRKSFYRLQQLSKFNIPIQILDEGEVKEIESQSFIIIQNKNINIIIRFAQTQHISAIQNTNKKFSRSQLLQQYTQNIVSKQFKQVDLLFVNLLQISYLFSQFQQDVNLVNSS